MSDKERRIQHEAAGRRLTGRARSHPELVRHLDEQLGFLRSSAAAVDEGIEAEGKRLATTLRVLLHTKGRQVGLVSQLGIDAVTEFIDTATPIRDSNLVSTPGFLIMQAGPDGIRWLPALNNGGSDRYGRTKPFNLWWSRPCIRFADKTDITREDLVLSVADREGGAHIDPSRDPVYEVLASGTALGWVATDETGEPLGPPQGDPALLSVRQIAYEVIETLAPVQARLVAAVVG